MREIDELFEQGVETRKFGDKIAHRDGELERKGSNGKSKRITNAGKVDHDSCTIFHECQIILLLPPPLLCYPGLG